MSYTYILKFFFKLLLLVALLEVSFRVLVPASELPFYVFDHKDNILKYDNRKQRDGLFTSGSLAEIRSRWHVNNIGWLNDRDYTGSGDKPVIAIIGNSYIEALPVNPDRNLTSDLQQQLGNKYAVYSFGISGAKLSEYLHVSRYVRKHFHPQVMIFNLVDDDISGSQLSSDNKEGNLYFSYSPSGVKESFVPYIPSKIGLYYRKSALLRYGRFNNGMFDSGKSPSALSRETKSNYNKEFTDYAFAKIRLENPGCAVIIVIDAPRRDIYQGITEKKNDELRNIVESASIANGFQLVDLTSPMTDLYSNNHLKFEFETNYHWNEYGYRVVSDQIYKKLIDSGVVTHRE